MEGLVLLVIALMFLPFLVSLAGQGGVWKFLSLLLGLSAVGVGMATSGSAIMFGPWIIAWIFTGIALAGGASERRLQRLEAVSTVREAPPFEPDGVYAGVPYRVLPGGAIDAIMQGAVVRFKDMDTLLKAAGGK